MAAIYIIENKENGKKYVGKTTLSDPYQRWRQHKYNTKSNYNPMVISDAMSKYGIDNFTFYVIETCNEDVINERETYWIEKFDTYRNGYNSTLGGEGIKRDLDLLYHPFEKPVSCYTLEGKHLKDYKSRGVASEELGILRSCIHACIKGITFQAGGYRWSWKDSELVNVVKRKNKRGKVYGIHKNGEKKVWNSQADCAEELEGDRKKNSNVSGSINSPNDNKTHCKDWYLFREETKDFTPATKTRSKEFYQLAAAKSVEKRKIPVYGLCIKTGERIEFKSMAEASFFIKGKGNYQAASNITNCIKKIESGNLNSHAFGYQWFKL